MPPRRGSRRVRGVWRGQRRVPSFPSACDASSADPEPDARVLRARREPHALRLGASAVALFHRRLRRPHELQVHHGVPRLPPANVSQWHPDLYPLVRISLLEALGMTADSVKLTQAPAREAPVRRRFRGGQLLFYVLELRVRIRIDDSLWNWLDLSVVLRGIFGQWVMKLLVVASPSSGVDGQGEGAQLGQVALPIRVLKLLRLLRLLQ